MPEISDPLGAGAGRSPSMLGLKLEQQQVLLTFDPSLQPYMCPHLHLKKNVENFTTHKLD